MKVQTILIAMALAAPFVLASDHDGDALLDDGERVVLCGSPDVRFVIEALDAGECDGFDYSHEWLQDDVECRTNPHSASWQDCYFTVLTVPVHQSYTDPPGTGPVNVPAQDHSVGSIEGERVSGPSYCLRVTIEGEGSLPVCFATVVSLPEFGPVPFVYAPGFNHGGVDPAPVEGRTVYIELEAHYKPDEFTTVLPGALPVDVTVPNPLFPCNVWSLSGWLEVKRYVVTDDGDVSLQGVHTVPCLGQVLASMSGLVTGTP